MANPTKTPREVLSKHAFNAAKTYFTKKIRIDGKLTRLKMLFRSKTAIQITFTFNNENQIKAYKSYFTTAKKTSYCCAE